MVFCWPNFSHIVPLVLCAGVYCIAYMLILFSEKVSLILIVWIHLIQKRLSSELLHCALRVVAYPDRKAPWFNEFVHCCVPRPQSILFHTASMANTRMSLSHCMHLQCYLKIRYIHGALRSGYATIGNAQCNNSEDNHFWIRCILTNLYSTHCLSTNIPHIP